MQKGYTLIEISVVMAIVATLFTISIISLNQVQQKTYQSTSLEMLLSDIKLQQLKAMTGDTEFTGIPDAFGIHFGTDEYTLFRGATYSDSDPSNFTVALNPNLTFSSVLFNQSTVVFSKGSGEISGFTNGNNTITITNTVNEENTIITLNRYGVITNIQ